MERKDVRAYIEEDINKVNRFYIYELYAKYLKDKSDPKVMADLDDFYKILDEVISATNVERAKFGLRVFKSDITCASSYLKPFYEYAMHKFDKACDTIWDIGCGAFPLNSLYLHEEGYDITAIDPVLHPFFLDYFNMKYVKGTLQSARQFIDNKPTALIGINSCDGFKPMLDMARDYDLKLVAKSCDCMIVTEKKESLFGESNKTRYYLSKYSNLRLGSILEDDTPSSENIGIENILEAR